MADLNSLQATEATRIVGSDATGLETNTVNATSANALHVNLRDVSGTELGTVANPVRVSMPDVSPSNGSITAQDTATTTLVGSNGQSFYTGTPTTNSSANFTLSSIEVVDVQYNLLGGGGTLVIEVSMDGGTFWTRPNIFQNGTTNYTNSFSGPFIAAVNVAGMTNLRVRAISAWTGTATIIAKESVNSRTVIVTDSNLPVGAATSAAQTTMNSTLTSIDAGIPIALGQTTMSASMAVTIASDQSAVPASQSGTWNVNNISGTVSLPTGAATAVNQSTEIASLQIIDNLVHTNNAALNSGVPLMGQMDDTSTVAATEDNVSVTRITAQRALHVNIRNASGTELGVSANPVVVSGTLSPSDSTKTTYSASITGLVAGALATDIFTITGSATKTVRITYFIISATSAAGSNSNVQLIKRSTANTGGTSTTPAITPHDSANAAGTAVVRAYTLNPTLLGTTVGIVRSFKEFLSGVVTADAGRCEMTFGDRPGQAIVLRGTSEMLAVNLNATTISSSSFNISIEFTEE